MKDEFVDQIAQSIGNNQISMLRFTMFTWFCYILLMLFLSAVAYNKYGLWAISTMLPHFGSIGFTFAILYGNKPPGVRIRDMMWKFYTGYIMHFAGYEEVRIIKLLSDGVPKCDYYIAGYSPLVVVFKDRKTAVLAKMII
jgi:hypothetical protein